MSPRFPISFPRANAFRILFVCAVMAWPKLTAVAQKQGTSAYGDVCMKASLADLANAHGHANVGFNPPIYSVPDKPFTANRVYTFRRIHLGQLNSQERPSVLTAITKPDLSEEVIIARDRMGRVHYETRQPARGEIAIMIYDPVAHTLSEYYLTADRDMPDNAVATVKRMQRMSKLSRPIAETPAEESSDHATDSIVSKSPVPTTATPVPAPITIDPSPRDLLEQSIEGYRVIGYRLAHKYGERNEYLQTQDDWLSPDYLIGILQDIVRDSIGESTIETRDIVDGEPDPSLFRVPGGYLIRKEQ
jgi:hypothetical protein